MFEFFRTENGKVTTKILAVLLVITLAFANFILLGTNLAKWNVSLALDNTVTEENNVTFGVYLDEAKTSTETTVDINNKDLKLYVSVEVKNQGSLENAKLELTNTNFYLKEDSSKTSISLGTIQAGSKVEKSYEIVPKTDTEFNLNWLNMDSTVALTGTYKSDSGNKQLSSDNQKNQRKVHINLNAPTKIGEEENENHKAQIEQSFIANQILSVNGSNKRVLQESITSNIVNNSYPVKSTYIEIKAPKLGEVYPESIKVASYGTAATNGKYLEFGTKEENKAGSYEYDQTNHLIKITVNNNPNEENIISWEKDVPDSFVVTYIYPENVEVKNLEAEATSKITMYTYVKDSNENYAQATNKVTHTALQNIALEPMLQTAATEETYKGNLNIGNNTEFRTVWLAGVSNADLINSLALANTENDKFNEEAEVDPNTIYKYTYINVEEMNYILGENGEITITAGENEIKVNKNTAKSQKQGLEAYYEVLYTGNVESITMQTSKPVKEGIITIINDKVLKSNEETQTALDKITELTTSVAASYFNAQNQVVGEATNSENKIKISNTESKATIAVDKKQISTIQETEVNFTITLKEDSIKYNLYKNPVIKVELPSFVKSIADINKTTDVSLVNADGSTLKIENVSVEENIINITLSGESVSYGINPQITLKAKLQTEKIMPTLEETVKLTVTGEEIESATATTKLTAASENKMLTVTSVKVGEEGVQTAFKENITAKTLPTANESVIPVVVTGTVINNTGVDATNTTVIGKIEKGLNAAFKSISGAETIFYTADAEVKEDSTWQETMPENATGYKLVFANLANKETKTFTVTLELPQNLETNKSMDLSYTVINGETKTNSPVITLQTPQQTKLELTVTPSVENGKAVYEGQKLSYQVKVKNTGNSTAKNINVTNTVPNGTELVAGSNAEWQIASLEAGKEETKTLELTVANLEETETSKEIKVTTKVEQEYLAQALTNTVTNTVNKAPVQVTFTLEDTGSLDKIVLGNRIEYLVSIKNNSGEDIQNLKIENTMPEELEYIQIFLQDENNFVKNNNVYSIENVSLKNGETKIIEINTNIVNYNKNGLTNELKLIWGNSNIATFSDTREMVVPEALNLVLSSDKENVELKKDDIIEYNLAVQNDNNQDIISNIKFKLSDGQEITNIEVPNDEILVSDEIKQSGEFTVENTVLEKGTTNIKVTAKVTEDEETITENKTLTAEGFAIRGNYTESSNRITNTVKKADPATLKLILESVKANKEVITGDIIEYYAIVKNENNKDITTDLKISLTNGLEITKIEKVNTENIPMETINVESKQEYTIEDAFITAEGSIRYKITANVVKDVNTITQDQTLIAKVASIREDLTEESNSINVILKAKGTTPDPKPDDPKPDDPKPDNPDPINKYSLSGKVWLDQNRDGKQDEEETGVNGIKVKIKNAVTNEFIKDQAKNDLVSTTNQNGEYTFNNLEVGKYILVFDCDVNKYGVSRGEDSIGVIATEDDKTFVKTDIIEITDKDVQNVNIGLVENPKFDLQLDKYVSKITVQNTDETTTYNFNKTQFAKVEIPAKKMADSLVVVEYTIDVTNKGEIPGYVESIVDYVSPEYTFSSELNTNWYEGTDGNLYTLELMDEEIKPGETKSVTLILSKVMTNTNTGLITNIAEIEEDFNEFAFEDVNSVPGNMEEKENDISSADVIIGVKTGGVVLYIGIFIASMLILGGGIYLSYKKVIAKKVI